MYYNVFYYSFNDFNKKWFNFYSSLGLIYYYYLMDFILFLLSIFKFIII